MEEVFVGFRKCLVFTCLDPILKCRPTLLLLFQARALLLHSDVFRKMPSAYRCPHHSPLWVKPRRPKMNQVGPHASEITAHGTFILMAWMGSRPNKSMGQWRVKQQWNWHFQRVIRIYVLTIFFKGNEYRYRWGKSISLHGNSELDKVSATVSK